MADPEHLEILRKGVEKWNRWRQETNVQPRLSDADLNGADLSGADLSGADLTGSRLESCNLCGASLNQADFLYALPIGADFSHATLKGCDLTGINLSWAKFRDADLSGAVLRRSNLSGTELMWANLRDSEFSSAILSGADFSGARFSSTGLGAVDLRLAKGLEIARHDGPSPVGSQTLEMGKGLIPSEFLKGCGFPDWEVLAAKLHDPDLPPDEVIDITYRIADLRTHAPIVPLSVFVSYAHEDKGFAAKVEGRLDKDGIRFWRDVHHLVAGPMEAQIDRAIVINGAVLLVLSKHSVESDWVLWEAEKARELEKKLKAEAGGEPRHRLCPVALDSSWETCDWPGWLRTQIRRYNVLDFSMWKTDERTFKAQYEKLKTGLGIYYRK